MRKRKHPRVLRPGHPLVCNPKFANQLFDSGSKPAGWLSAARSLRRSADTLLEKENPIGTRFWDEMHRIASLGDGEMLLDYDESWYPNFNVIYMLIAFAIENVLKGLAIAKGKVNPFHEELPDSLKTHDLHKLHKLAEPKATIEQHLPDSLSYMSEWRARYPVPVSIDRIWPTGDDGVPKLAGFTWPGSQQAFLAYYDAIEAELGELMSADAP